VPHPAPRAQVGICGRRGDGDVLNCASNVASSAPSATLGPKLQATCPTLWADKGGWQGRYCCTEEQVDKLATDVSPPACWGGLEGGAAGVGV
jgi:Niemann-Pick C1 protein